MVRVRAKGGLTCCTGLRSFFIIAIAAGVPGFGGIAGAASSVAQILFFLFIVIFLMALIPGWRRRPPRARSLFRLAWQRSLYYHRYSIRG